MMKTNQKTRRLWLYKAAVLICLCLVCMLAPFVGGKRVEAKAYNGYGDIIKVHSYDVVATISKDRTVQVVETFEIEFLAYGLTMFYRSLPIEDARYFDISATCVGNEEFSFYVADNPDISDFIDINCVGGVAKNKKWTYVISYTMQNGANAATSDNGMHIDLIGFGASVPMNNVTATVHFPYATTLENCKTYVGYDAETPTNVNATLSNDGKTFSFAIDRLDVGYVEYYGIWAADGVSLDFTLTEGACDSYFATRFFTDGLVWIVLFGAIAVGVVVALRFAFRKKEEIISVVNVKAPNGMDPLKMGKVLDGTVDTEDVTSMIYYFAHNGYLDIDFSDEEDPILKKKKDLPDDAPVYQKTLFKGLFKKQDEVAVSDLKEQYYVSVEKAKKQVPPVKMYDQKSLLGYVMGGIVALLYAFLMGFFLSAGRIGNGYADYSGFAFIFPIVAILAIEFLRENYRYKWKKGVSLGVKMAEIAIAALFGLVYFFFISNHVYTEYEKLLVCLSAYVALFIGMTILSRREDYVKTLGDIVGFKEFIVVTEEDRLKEMLEENPQLFYEVLPYAQVLGVTDVWEEKFANITIEPPTWCYGTHFTFFDYMIINRCMRTAMRVALSVPQSQGGGRFIGGSGGGGRFGGFGGGGFGGGGFGAR